MVYNYRELQPGERVDEGKKPISLEGVHEVPSSIRDDLSSRLADFIKGIAANGERVMTVGGKTSAGLFYVNGDSNIGRGIRGIEMKRVETAETLSSNIDVELVDGEPVCVTVPAGATVKSVNDYLRENFGAAFRVDYDITTSSTSHIGANLFTNGRGDNREAIDVLELTLIANSTLPKLVRNKKDIAALRASQGYAGTVTKLKLRVIKDFAKEEVWVLPLSSGGVSVYGESYAMVLSQLWEYMHSRNTNGMRIVGAEVLHRSGMETIRRVTNDEKNQAYRDSRWYEGSLNGKEGGVLLRVRHDFEAPLEENIEHPFVQSLLALNEEGAVGDFTPLSDAAQIERIDSLRAAVPEKAREEAGRSDVFSQSMDIDTVINVPEGIDPSSVRESIRAAFMAAIKPYLDAEDFAREQGIRAINNGHLLAVSREVRPGRDIDPYFDGGANPHTRFTGRKDQAGIIKGIHSQVGEDLRKLHGRSFGAVTLNVKEGEKHYPTDEGALIHFTSTNPMLAHERAKAISEAGEVFNFRTPKQTKATVMRTVGEVAAK